MGGLSRPESMKLLVVFLCCLTLTAHPGRGLAQSAVGRRALTPAQALGLVAPEQVPTLGTFYRVQKPDWPPLPMDNCPGCPVYWLGGNRYLIDDTGVDYAAQQEEFQALATLKTALGVRELDGEGLQPYYLSFSTNDLWLELEAVTNGLAAVLIHSPVADGVYDLFGTTNLNGAGSGLNRTNWAWLLRTAAGQSNACTAVWGSVEAYYQLGTTQDTDGDGLTDAFEHLVSHSDPALVSTRGDGFSDWLAYVQGRNPRVPGSSSDTQGSIGLQVYTPMR